jgi:hypothetical protein
VVTVSPDHLHDVERLRGLAGPADSELPPQAVAITAKPAIATIARARHKERFDPNGLVNSAGLARTGRLWVGAGNGRRHAMPRPGAPGPQLERGTCDGMKGEFMQYAAVKSGCAGFHGARRC